MGILRYGTSELCVQVDDFTLLHLRLVAATMLARKEGFLLTWDKSDGGPISVWVSAAAPLVFDFAAPPRNPIDRDVLRDMAASATVASGLTLPTRKSESVKKNESVAG
jgi:hypothetical protein